MTDARILIVEDEGIVAKDLQNTLEGLGYTVTAVVPSAQEAVKKAVQTQPDLVLMDIILKGYANGVEAATAIRQLNIPVVYLTAYSDDETLRRAKVTEPYGYILKPFEERELHIAIEIALHKHAMEKKIRESEQWLIVTLRSIGDAVIATDAKGLVKFMNPVAEALTGWKRDEAAGKPLKEVFQIVNEETGKKVITPAARVLNEGTLVRLNDRALLVSRDGTRIPVDDCAAPIKDDQGNIIGVVLVFRDITERRKIEKDKRRWEAQLRQAQKMEALGRLAGGIAHDFNNLLTAIGGYADLALAAASGNKSLCDDIDEIRKACARARALTRQLLLFGRLRPTKSIPLDLNEIVRGLLKMLRRLLTENITLRSSLAENLWTIRGDPGSIEQVILNLVVNARDAMPQGGEIVISTENVHVDETFCETCEEARTGDFVRLSVWDSGVGMDREILEHIVEPFFTTKKPGEGTGMGLAVVYGILKQHQGWMSVHSRPNEGTLVSVYLPAISGPARAEREKPMRLEALRGNGERILLIEDNEGVRKFTARGLSEHGYVVLEAGDAAEAQAVFEKEKGDFDLIFSDVVLPDESGPAVVTRLLQRKPDIAVAFTTGYSKGRTDWSIIEKGHYPYLLKPYSLSEMLAFVHDTLKKKQVG